MKDGKGKIRDEEWLSDQMKSGALCTIDTRVFSGWMDTGKSAGVSKSYDEPLQGSVNDCFFIAALVSVALSAPAKLKTHPNYQFYNTTTKVWDPAFTTNALLAVDSGNNPIYARSKSAYIWPCLYEKAYAKWLDTAHSDTPSIPTLLNGGGGSTALLNLCGGVYRSKQPVPFPWSVNKPTYPSIAMTSGTPPSGLTANHTYSVIGKTATQWTLRNPCGGGTAQVLFADLNASKFSDWGYVIPG